MDGPAVMPGRFLPMTAPITLRACTSADAEALSLVGSATFLESYAHQIGGADIVAHCKGQHGPAYYAKALGDAESRCWIAETSTTAPVGYQMLTTPDLPVELQAGDIEIKRIYILSRFQGGGLGRRMVDAALDAARAMGKTRVLLGVYSENLPAQGFYARMGFSEIGDRYFTVGGREFYDKVLARPV